MSKVSERQTVTSTSLVQVGVKCDQCGKVAKCEDIPKDWHSFGIFPDSSYGDMVWVELCSPTCYIGKLRSVLEDHEKGDSVREIDEMTPEFLKLLINQIEIKPTNGESEK